MSRALVIRVASSGVATAVLLLAACATGDLPATHYYTLQPPTDAPALNLSTAVDGLVVGVETLAVDPPYDQDRLVYRLGEDSAEVGFYAYHRWASPLGRLLAVALADGLRGTGGIRDIEPSSTEGAYTARLAGRVLRLEEVDTPAGQEVHIALRLNLEDATGAALWSATLTATAKTHTDRVPEVIAAAQIAVADLIAQARREIAAVLR